MTDVLIKREQLERLLYVMDNYVTHETPEEDELRAILAAPRQPEGEGLEVVGVLCVSRFKNNPAMENVEFQLAADVAQGQHDLCRLSDHQRAIAELQAENAKLRAELERLAVDGWELVPVEPTPEMVDSALLSSTAIDPRSIVIEDYKCMLAAAPSPPLTISTADIQSPLNKD